MWDSIWINAHLATMRMGRYGIVRRAALGVEKGKLAWVGARADLPGDPAQLAHEVHDCEGRWITPGLIDCHTHIVHAGNRAHEFELRSQGAGEAELAQAGSASTVSATREASEMELIRSASARLKRLMDEGVTTVEIKSGYGLDARNEMKMLRVARLLGESDALTVKTAFLPAHALPQAYRAGAGADAYVDLVCAEMLPAAAEARLADAVDVVCASDGFDLRQTRRILETARALKLPVVLHADQFADDGGAALASDFGALYAAHLEYLSVAGVGAMAAAGAVAVVLPGSNYFLRQKQLPPVGLLRSHGVPIAIASDCNPGSSPSGSILLMLNLACTLFGLTPEEALAGVTCHAARALGMQDSHGTLEAGKEADFALWDMEHPAELAYAMGAIRSAGVVKRGIEVHRPE